jgi:NarL family two-component system response regulator LiaR
MNTVVLLDEHPMMRRALDAYLTETGKYQISGEASNLTDARALFSEVAQVPDLVILDICLGDENGLELLKYLKAIQREKRKNRGDLKKPLVLVFSAVEDPFRIQQSLHLGVRGYVSKAADEGELIKALDAVIRGNIYIDERLRSKVMKAASLFEELTKRERGILGLIKKNYDNRTIAEDLDIKLRTVENYISKIYTKTGAGSRGELMRI